MRFVKLQLLLLLVMVLLVAALAADFVLKGRAEDELATEVTARVAGTSGVRAKISSFPFVGRLLLAGKVAQVVVTAQHSTVADVDLSDIRVRVEDVAMDSDAARQGRVVVRSIGRGDVRADLREDQINSRLPRGYKVSFTSGKATVTGPVAVPAQLVTTPEGSIQVQVAGRLPLLTLPFPKTDLLPCPPSASFVSGAVRLSCAFKGVPPLLLDLAKR